MSSEPDVARLATFFLRLRRKFPFMLLTPPRGACYLRLTKFSKTTQKERERVINSYARIAFEMRKKRL
jgi:hypothetical protein